MCVCCRCCVRAPFVGGARTCAARAVRSFLCGVCFPRSLGAVMTDVPLQPRRHRNPASGRAGQVRTVRIRRSPPEEDRPQRCEGTSTGLSPVVSLRYPASRWVGGWSENFVPQSCARSCEGRHDLVRYLHNCVSTLQARCMCACAVMVCSSRARNPLGGPHRLELTVLVAGALHRLWVRPSPPLSRREPSSGKVGKNHPTLFERQDTPTRQPRHVRDRCL